jgi:apolipoprotein N-acyltransferase
MLVPLETLSGWPQVQNPSPLFFLGLLFGVPILVFIIVIAINKIVTAAHARHGEDVHSNDPLWVGAHQPAEVGTAGANPGVEGSDQVAEVTAGEANVEGDDTGEHVGGAGARW